MKVHIPVALTHPGDTPRSGVASTASWEQLKPLIGEAINLQSDEFITDITITLDGIKANIGRRPDAE